MMKLQKLACIAIMAAASAAAQVPSHQQTTANPHGGMGMAPGAANPHGGSAAGHGGGVVGSRRLQFAQECGISDAALEKAKTLIRAPKSGWSVLNPKKPGDSNAVVRVWQEKAWMVDLQEAGRSADSLHVARMCFGENKNVKRIHDEYMEASGCNCTRITEATYDNGKLVKQEQNYFKIANSEKVATPGDAAAMPPVVDYKKLEQLPFWGFVMPAKK